MQGPTVVGRTDQQSTDHGPTSCRTDGPTHSRFLAPDKSQNGGSSPKGYLKFGSKHFSQISKGLSCSEITPRRSGQGSVVPFCTDYRSSSSLAAPSPLCLCLFRRSCVPLSPPSPHPFHFSLTPLPLLPPPSSLLLPPQSLFLLNSIPPICPSFLLTLPSLFLPNPSAFSSSSSSSSPVAPISSSLLYDVYSH